MYVARTRNGFVSASRRQVFSKLKHLVTPTCPFVNLPETRRSRFGEELSAEKTKKAVWLRPEAVAQIEFLEWTDAYGSLRDSNPILHGVPFRVIPNQQVLLRAGALDRAFVVTVDLTSLQERKRESRIARFSGLPSRTSLSEPYIDARAAGLVSNEQLAGMLGSDF